MKMIKVKEKLFEEINCIIKETEERVKFLNEDTRNDEAVFEKVKLNICDIFKTLYEATEKRVANIQNDESKGAQFKKIYLEYFESIPKSWYDNLEKARVNNAFQKVKIEEIKIDTKDIIKEKFVELWERNA